MIDAPDHSSGDLGERGEQGVVYVRMLCARCGKMSAMALPQHIGDAWEAYTKVVQILAAYDGVGAAGALGMVADVIAPRS